MWSYLKAYIVTYVWPFSRWFAMKSELEDLRKMNTVYIKGMHSNEHKDSIIELGSRIMPLMGEALGQQFKIAGGVNNVTMTLEDPRTFDRYECVFQKVGMKTPTQQRDEYLARVKELEAELDVERKKTFPLLPGVVLPGRTKMDSAAIV